MFPIHPDIWEWATDNLSPQYSIAVAGRAAALVRGHVTRGCPSCSLMWVDTAAAENVSRVGVGGWGGDAVTSHRCRIAPVSGPSGAVRALFPLITISDKRQIFLKLTQTGRAARRSAHRPRDPQGWKNYLTTGFRVQTEEDDHIINRNPARCF